MVFLAPAVDAQKHFLGEVLGFLGIGDQVMHHGDQALMVQLNQLGKSLVVVVADAQHEPHIRIAQGQLLAALERRFELADEIAKAQKQLEQLQRSEVLPDDDNEATL